MKKEEIILDENMEMYIFIKELNIKVCLALSDDLYAYDEELTDQYKEKIVEFVNTVSQWYDKSVQAILEYAQEVYSKFKIETKAEDLRLLYITVLFEQNEEELFGLEFRAEFDVEHGCGLKIKGKTFEIIEVGAADVG